MKFHPGAGHKEDYVFFSVRAHFGEGEEASHVP
jgi:hypothetical protein